MLLNFVSLSSINLLNLLAPVIVIPWLLHTLGVRLYGVIALHQYLGQFVLMWVDFGFNTWAVNEVAGRAQDRRALAALVGSIYLLKLALCAVVVLAFGVLALNPRWVAAAGLNLPLLAAFAALGALNSFYPGWLFQGLERIHALIVPTALARLGTVALVFVLVRQPRDMWAVPVAYLASSVLLDFSAARQLLRSVGWPTLLPWRQIVTVAQHAGQVFWSRLIIMIYVACSPLLVRAAAGAEGVAVYSLCEKAIGLCRVPFDMLANAAYPRLAREYRKTFAQRLLQLQLAAALGVVLLLTAALHFAGPYLLPADWAHAGHYLMLYSLALIPIAAHSFMGTCVLLVHGKRWALSLSIVVGLAAYIAAWSAFGWLWADPLARVITAMVMVEFGICASRYFHSRKSGLI